MLKPLPENKPQRSLKSIFWQAFNEWYNDNSLRMSASLAFYTVLSLSPLLLLVISITGPLLGPEAARTAIIQQFAVLIGEESAGYLSLILQNANRPFQGLIGTIVSIITLAIGATGAFAELQSAIDIVWDVKKREEGKILSFLRQRFLSVIAIVGISFLLLVSLVLHAGFAAWVTFMQDNIGFNTTVHIEIVNFFSSFVLSYLLFAMIFRTLPSVALQWRDVWFGAFITALMFSVGKYLFGLYLGRTAVASVFGAAGSLVAIMMWVYFSAMVLFYGAEVSQVYAKWRGSFKGRKHIPKKAAGE
jgi:membrane protein